MSWTQAGLVALLVIFVLSAIVQAVLAVAVDRAHGERVWFWRIMTIISTVMAALYFVEVFRLRSIEDNLPWVLTGAAVWVAMMGVAAPLDGLARLRTGTSAARELTAAVHRSRETP